MEKGKDSETVLWQRVIVVTEVEADGTMRVGWGRRGVRVLESVFVGVEYL